jgi:hypothetical protein
MASFGPPITALHVLMMYATAGNLDTYLLNRSQLPSSPSGEEDLPNAERIKAFKRRKSSRSTRQEELRGVLMPGREEVAKLFGDVVDGLAFLVSLPLIELTSARQFDIASRPQMLKRPAGMGRRQTHAGVASSDVCIH